MRIIRDLNGLDKNAVMVKTRGVQNFSSHIKPILEKSHCCLVDVFANDFSKLLMFSGLPNTSDPRHQPISEVVDYIIENPDFLNYSRHDGFLSGGKVKNYLAQLSSYASTLQECFDQLGYCFVEDRSTFDHPTIYDVTDGTDS